MSDIAQTILADAGFLSDEARVALGVANLLLGLGVLAFVLLWCRRGPPPKDRA